MNLFAVGGLFLAAFGAFMLLRYRRAIKHGCHTIGTVTHTEYDWDSGRLIYRVNVSFTDQRNKIRQATIEPSPLFSYKIGEQIEMVHYGGQTYSAVDGWQYGIVTAFGVVFLVISLF